MPEPDEAHMIRVAIKVASAQNYEYVATEALAALDTLLARVAKLEQIEEFLRTWLARA